MGRDEGIYTLTRCEDFRHRDFDKGQVAPAKIHDDIGPWHQVDDFFARVVRRGQGRVGSDAGDSRGLLRYFDLKDIRYA